MGAPPRDSLCACEGNSIVKRAPTSDVSRMSRVLRSPMHRPRTAVHAQLPCGRRSRRGERPAIRPQASADRLDQLPQRESVPARRQRTRCEETARSRSSLTRKRVLPSTSARCARYEEPTQALVREARCVDRRSARRVLFRRTVHDVRSANLPLSRGRCRHVALVDLARSKP